ncbi:MAG TPA: hypothetical protein VFF14_02965, partial [Candidatus Deferrimicrobium sp.]|nr:hypothetical protein [Candidatus Deferrimicrobium sp.]
GVWPEFIGYLAMRRLYLEVLFLLGDKFSFPFLGLGCVSVRTGSERFRNRKPSQIRKIARIPRPMRIISIFNFDTGSPAITEYL